MYLYSTLYLVARRQEGRLLAGSTRTTRDPDTRPAVEGGARMGQLCEVCLATSPTGMY